MSIPLAGPRRVRTESLGILVLALTFAAACASRTDPANALPETAAVERLRTSAEAGNVDAAWQLGLRHFTADGVARDYAAAASWLQRAADHQYAPAERDLGELYRDRKSTRLNSSHT